MPERALSTCSLVKCFNIAITVIVGAAGPSLRRRSGFSGVWNHFQTVQTHTFEKCRPIVPEHISTNLPGQIYGIALRRFSNHLLRLRQIHISQRLPGQRPQQARSVEHIFSRVVSRDHNPFCRIFHAAPECRLALRKESRVLVEYRGENKIAKKVVGCRPRQARSEAAAIRIPTLAISFGIVTGLTVGGADGRCEEIRWRDTFI